MHPIRELGGLIGVVLSVFAREGHLEPPDVVVADEAGSDVEHREDKLLLLEPVVGCWSVGREVYRAGWKVGWHV